jgi:hypothetical protein
MAVPKRDEVRAILAPPHVVPRYPTPEEKPGDHE